MDIILVKFGNDAQWGKTLAWAEAQNATIHTWDNTHHNIGLVAARLQLIEQSTAPYFLLLDYDFESIDVHLGDMLHAMHSLDCALCQPGDGSGDFHIASAFPCNFLLVDRRAYNSVGGLDPDFHTAYADWDLINRLGPPAQHNPSTVKHLGRPADDHKRSTWDADHQTYVRKWGKASPATWFAQNGPHYSRVPA